jgi:orotate phosphoribosyltransferase
MALQGARAQVADMLFELGAIKFGAFRLKLHEKQPDAPLSPIYLNLRTADHPKNPGPLGPVVMGLIGQILCEEVNLSSIGAKFICGIPDAGEPFVDRMQVSFDLLNRIYLTKVVREDGSREVVPAMGYPVYMGEECLVVDDLITQADSKIETIQALEGMGLSVHNIYVLVDRMQGGREQLEAHGYRLHAGFRLNELLAHYVGKDYIDHAKVREVMQYVIANRAA